MPDFSPRKQFGSRPHIWLIALIGVIVPRKLRADWRQEWEAELRHRERLLAEWDRLDRRNKLELLRRSLSAFWDALCLQPQRLEDEMIQDLRYGARMLLKNPGFTLVVALSLALGIGANTAVFSLLDAVLLKTLPVNQPERLVLFNWLPGDKGIFGGGVSDMDFSDPYRARAVGPKTNNTFSYPAFEQLRAHNESCSEIFAFVRLRQVNLSVDGQAEVVVGQAVSGNYFAGLGVTALLGRMLNDGDDRAGAAAATVISHSYWQRRFGGDPGAVGKVVYLSGTAFTIAGVTRPEFKGALNFGNVPDISLPMAFMPQLMTAGFSLSSPKGTWAHIIGRLKTGVSQAQAQAQLNPVWRQHLTEALNPKDQRDLPQLILTSGGQGLMEARRIFSRPLWVLMILVGLVLLIVCLNLGALLLARAAGRQKEIAVRLAAGASRLRLIRQLLTESLLLAGLGGALGLLFAWWGKDALVALQPLGRPISSLDLNLDLRALGFTAAVSLLTGIVFGLTPALRATRVDLISALKDGAGDTGYSRSRLSKGLIVAQVAMSLLLLVGAGLFVRTLRNLTQVEVGFNRENLLLFRVNPQLIGYEGIRRANLYQQLIERIEAVPGVRSAAVSNHPLFGGWTGSNFCVPGYTPQPGEEMSLRRMYVGANFFDTMEIPILKGRGLTPQDNEPMLRILAILETPEEQRPRTIERPRLVAVINQAMARKYFPNDDPVGRRFSFGSNCANGGSREIVGVAKDIRNYGLREEIRPVVYLPYVAGPGEARDPMNFSVRAEGDPAALITAVRRAVQSVDPNLPLFGVKTQQAQIDESVAQPRLFASLSSFFGLLALILVAIGLYGVMSYTVARRTHEIGVRMALGAERGDVMRLVMRETLWLALAGVTLGISAAIVATRWIESQLFGLAPRDPWTITLVTLLLMAVMALAGYLPARKATQVDPLIALRCE